MIRKLLIANRGEIACRIIRTCHDMGIAAVAVFSDADKDAMHVPMADEAIRVGAAPASESYLKIENIIRAAKRSHADAIHPGYGFLAENAKFAQAVVDNGLLWIGPAPDVIAAMGDKVEAKKLLKDVPYVPGYIGDDQSDAAFIEAAEGIGYPIMVKAAAGGGGRGMRLVTVSDDLPEALVSARREALQSFGDERLMLEKALISPRHIEVQIFGDTAGQVIALGERECSIQRRHQKIIEETPAFGLDDATRNAMHQTAVQIGEQLNYTNAGTVEFLLDADNQFYFMEMNTRLQVEHPVTEMVFGLDLVQWQLQIAEGKTLSELIAQAGFDDHPEPNGHAIEARIYTEDPANDFLPAIGRILHFHEPDFARMDSGVCAGDTVSPHYDPMVAKVITHATDRISAIRKLDYALSQLQLLGLKSNISFLRRVLIHDAHLEGLISTRFLQDHADLLQASTEVPDVILLGAAIAKHQNGLNRWRNNPNRPIEHRYQVEEDVYEVSLTPVKQGVFSAEIAANVYQVSVCDWQHNTYRLDVDGHMHNIVVVEAAQDMWWVATSDGTFQLKWLSPLPLPNHTVRAQGSLHAPMPGQVIAIHVEVGQTVMEGDVLLVLEAMKMEHRIEAPYEGVVETILYSIGDSVQQDDVLLSLNSGQVS